MLTLANSEDPDEMLHNAAFHRGLQCLLGQKKGSFLKRNTILFGNYNLVTLGYYIYNGPFQIYCIKPEGRIH